jgi:hypothetical protein
VRVEGWDCPTLRASGPHPGTATDQRLHAA